MSKQTVIYILGSGHSGSTILQYLLAAYPGVIGLGEVSALAHQNKLSLANEKCSCGYSIFACQLWGDLLPSGEATPHWYERLVTTIGQSYSQVTHLVDSSKSIHGLLPWLEMARKGLIAGIYIIYLVRDVRGWVFSEISRRQRKTLPSRSIFLLMLDWKRRQKRMLSHLEENRLDYFPLSYEALSFDTLQVLTRFAEIADLQEPAEDITCRLQDCVAHDVYGNRMKDDIQKRTRIKYDDRWQYHYTINLIAPVLFPVWRLNSKLRLLGKG